MGRIFEVRKSTMFARYDRMAKQFSRIGKEIAIAVKKGGADPNTNPMLRRVIQNGKSVNMPKDRIEAAIKNALGKDTSNYDEVLYEGYAPHGIAILVVTATDNTTRTVANVRMHLSKGSGTLGTNGSVSFMFDRKGVFKLNKEGIKLDELELDLIDFGAEEIVEEEDGVYLYTKFSDFGSMQKGLEAKGIEPLSAEKQWIPIVTKELDEAYEEQVFKLIATLEEDDDVQAVYHNLS